MAHSAVAPSMPEGFEGVSMPVLARLLDSMPHGVIVLDEASRVVIYNATEERLAGRRRDRVLGRDFFREVAPCMNVAGLAGEFRARIGRTTLDASVEMSFPFPHLDQPRDVTVRMRSFVSSGRPYGFLVIEDVSLERSIARMREALSSFLVHDLKNPLSAVLANLDFLQDRDSLAPDARDALGDARDAARRLQRMLVNLLDVTRLETNALPLDRRPTSLPELAAEVAADNEATSRLRGVTIATDLPVGPVVEWVDADVMRRVLHNLVENAVRFARCRVVVRVERTPGGIALEVSDDGRGLPEKVRSSIFEKYVQVTAGSSATANRGLGLTFVRLAVRAHGGDVTVSCPASGGSVFRAELPHRTERAP